MSSQQITHSNLRNSSTSFHMENNNVMHGNHIDSQLTVDRRLNDFNVNALERRCVGICLSIFGIENHNNNNSTTGTQYDQIAKHDAAGTKYNSNTYILCTLRAGKLSIGILGCWKAFKYRSSDV